MSRRYYHLLVTALVLLAAVSGCSGIAEQPKRPDTLIVLPGATKLWQGKRGTTEQVYYVVKEEYPAKSAIRRISDGLAKQGWKPLKEDFLNPGLKSSHVGGWSEFLDSTKPGGGPGGPERQVRQWIADWTNARGDVARYCLRYVWPASGPENKSELEVAGDIISAKAVKEMREWVLRQKSQSSHTAWPEHN